MKFKPLLILCFISTSALAIGTSHWTHTSEADFKAGTFHNVVATNLGDLKLSRAVDTILGGSEHVSAVHSLAQAPDGTIYAGTGPEGVLLSIKKDKVKTVATLGDNVSIFSLLIDAKGRLLIGTGGDKGQILSIDKPGDKPKEIFAEDGVQYIFAMCQTPDGKIYAATGPNGQLFEVGDDGKHEVVLDSEQNNLTCIASDGKDLLYVGSDPDGLVYRVNRKSKDVFVMFDAPETEISALVLDKDGTLYAGTAAAAEAAAENADQPGASDQVGRPESDTGGVPIPTQPPEAPKPPQPAPPNPGEPAPIPKAKKSDEPKHLMILADDPADPGAGDNPGDNPEPPKSPVKNAAAATAAAAAQTLAAKTGEPAAANTGNAVYRIDKDGFVTEVFRQQVIVDSLIEQNGSLLVGTGSEGMIYQVNPAAEETVVLAKVDSKEVTALLATKDGRVFMGLSNAGDIAAMTSGVASDGTFTSPVLDATQISRFGKMQLHGTLPAGTKITVATRSSNVGEDSDQGWGAWSKEQPATEFMPIESAAARYLQYRLTFTSDDGKETPVVDDVDVAYQMPNLAPQIKTVKIATKAPDTAADATAQAAASKQPTEHYMQTITWEASDPNNDLMQFSVYFRNGARGPWILLKDKLTDLTWDWDTRTVADGRYEIKVVASDEAANPRGMGKTTSRVSDPVEVDNTAPIVGDIKAVAKGAVAHIELRAVDRTSTIASLEYSVDSSTDWQTVLPSDNIADSPDEAYSFDTQPLAAGAHQITLRATDAHGNQGHESVTITVEAPTAMK